MAVPLLDYTVCVDSVSGGPGGCLVFSRGVLREIREEPSGVVVIDFRGKDSIAYPGFVDLHVHLRGLRLAHKEDEYSGTRAAASGCLTLVADMPNTDPELRTPEALKAKLAELGRAAIVDYAVYAGVPLVGGVARRLAEAGAAGFKVYPEDLRSPHLCEVLRAAEEKSLVVVLHPEDPWLFKGPDWGYLRGTAHRGCEAEAAAVELAAEAIEECGSHPRVHVTHASCPATVAAARRHGFTVDVAPHHLLLWAEAEDASTPCIYKVNPPLKPYVEAHRLLQLVASGEVDAMASDHAPHTRLDKSGNAAACSPGFVWLEWWPLVAARMLAPTIGHKRLVELLHSAPRRILGLEPEPLEPERRASVSILIPGGYRSYPRGLSKAWNSPLWQLPTWECGATIVRGVLAHIYGGGILAGPGVGRRAAPPLDEDSGHQPKQLPL